LELARSRLALGRALAAAGDGAAAARVLAQAEADLAFFGARRDRDQAARELRALGRSAPRRAGLAAAPRRAGRATADARLSARERQVADLVAIGRTNRQIAAQLHISVNTVETHLRRIFAKLEVSSRAAVGTSLRTADRSQ
jgi:DNA-binding CsgD family transcriptional regulator